jgi:hypothetical protein
LSQTTFPEVKSIRPGQPTPTASSKKPPAAALKKVHAGPVRKADAAARGFKHGGQKHPSVLALMRVNDPGREQVSGIIGETDFDACSTNIYAGKNSLHDHLWNRRPDDSVSISSRPDNYDESTHAGLDQADGSLAPRARSR